MKNIFFLLFLFALCNSTRVFSQTIILSDKSINRYTKFSTELVRKIVSIGKYNDWVSITLGDDCAGFSKRLGEKNYSVYIYYSIGIDTVITSAAVIVNSPNGKSLSAANETVHLELDKVRNIGTLKYSATKNSANPNGWYTIPSEEVVPTFEKMLADIRKMIHL